MVHGMVGRNPEGTSMMSGMHLAGHLTVQSPLIPSGPREFGVNIITIELPSIMKGT